MERSGTERKARLTGFGWHAARPGLGVLRALDYALCYTLAGRKKMKLYIDMPALLRAWH